MVINESGDVKVEYSVLLLFSFLFGALLTFIYMGPIKSGFEMFDIIPLELMLLFFALCCMLASSITGFVLIPLVSVLFGSAAAREFARIKDAFLLDPDYKSLAVLLIMVPVYFIVCNWGMNCSKSTLSGLQCKDISNRVLIIPFALMFLGLIMVIGLSLNIMII